MLNKQGLFGQSERYRRDARTGAEAQATPPEPARQEATKPAPEATKPVVDTPAPKTEVTSGSRLTVGPDIKLKCAEITDCDTLVVEGRVEASMDSRLMQIAESGSVHGTVGVDVAEINGRFEGDLTVRKQLVIHATGKVSGKIRYGKLVIEEGGEIAGDVAAIGAAKPAAAAIGAPRPAALTQAANA